MNWKCSVVEGSSPKSESCVRVMFFSDTHTNHNKIPQEWIFPCDIAIFAGDFSYHGGFNETKLFSDWYSSIPATYKVLIAGNHELSFDFENQAEIRHYNTKDPKDNDIQRIKSLISENKKLIYLEDQTIEILGLKIFGSPYSPYFCDWGFPTFTETAHIHWDLIEENTHIVVTHGPVLGVLDETVRGDPTGCPVLLEKLKQVKPLVHVFGHIHEAYGIQQVENTIHINASTLNYHYKVQNPPIYIDFLRQE